MALSKNALIAIIAVVAVVIAGIGIAAASGVFTSKEDGVTYDGNGGVFNGKTSVTLTNETAVDNVFTKEGYVFVKWNTKADGTGTDYAVGASVSNGMKLFAIWNDKPLAVSSFGESISDVDTTKISFTINDRNLGIYSVFHPPALIVAKGGSNWSYDEANSVFIGTVGGVKCTLKITVTDYTEGSLEAKVDNGLPTVAFKATQDVGIWITLKATR